MKNKKWHHVVTRLMGLLEIQLANEVYPYFPIKRGGFNLDNIVIGRNGILERYVDLDQLEDFKRIIKENNYIKLLKGFKDYEKKATPLIIRMMNDPLKNCHKFMKIFRKLWIHEITGFYIGLYCRNKKALNIISHLRGTKSLQHIAVSDFLPKLLTEISKKLKIDRELLKYAMPNEIVSLKLNKKILILRRRLYVLILINGKLQLLTGAKAKKFVKNFTDKIKDETDLNVKEFKGTPAFSGKVSGKVVLVIHDKDLVKVKEGDILVSPMTRTSFISAMKRSGAFITDEGGVTCHAAIIARELKKPCIIGTKIASKVLKNGMKVLVDADSGMVKIV
ncbi:MAG: PEP-utilizing enzyme [Planctomycetes bacterium]|jgi:phosphohistidine swiveling domain-containing protein|nr:PEP-utilizing enzyme [Planctomycetota bacterium]